MAQPLNLPYWAIPQYGWDFPEEIPERSRKRSKSVSWNSPLGSPKPYDSRHFRLPEHFQNSLPPSTAGDASFSEVVLERAPQSWSWNSQQGISHLSRYKVSLYLSHLCFSGIARYRAIPAPNLPYRSLMWGEGGRAQADIWSCRGYRKL